MKDLNRIDVVLAALKFAWQKHPDMRLAQVLWTAAALGGSKATDPFHCEDEVMKRGLEILGSEK